MEINCIGNAYDLALPMIGFLNPNSLTMQQLCAGPASGGYPDPKIRLNGWCEKSSDHLNAQEARVVFEDEEIHGGSLDSFTPLTLKKERILLGCQYRCYCTEDRAGQRIQPRESTLYPNPVRQVSPEQAYQVKIDVVDDFAVTSKDHHGPIGSRLGLYGSEPKANAVAFWLSNEFAHLMPDTFFSYRVSLDQNNYIQCRGDLPRFPLPQPYNMSEFSNLDELCAVQWSGGKS